MGSFLASSATIAKNVCGGHISAKNSEHLKNTNIVSGVTELHDIPQARTLSTTVKVGSIYSTIVYYRGGDGPHELCITAGGP